ncbi:hypothetical protein Fmac_026528 [Flemingia macrophylla]|uniref:Uncharacterized protein n=1 Tax=Flemingia macrophylla TaxID=520843 RepID=A0ABD1LF49_9FABA
MLESTLETKFTNLRSTTLPMVVVIKDHGMKIVGKFEEYRRFGTRRSKVRRNNAEVQVMNERTKTQQLYIGSSRCETTINSQSID